MSVDQSTMTTDEVSSAIVTGMGFTYDLLHEAHALTRLLNEALGESNLELGRQLVRRFLLARARTEPVSQYHLVRTELGLMYELASSGADEESDDDEEMDEAETDEADEAGSSKKKVQVTPDAQYLGVRIHLYDPKHDSTTPFVPAVSAALFSDLQLMYTGKRKKQQLGDGPHTEFSIRAVDLPRLAKSLSPSAGNRVACTMTGRQLAASVSPIVRRPLAEFETAETIDQFVKAIEDLCEA